MPEQNQTIMDAELFLEGLKVLDPSITVSEEELPNEGGKSNSVDDAIEMNEIKANPRQEFEKKQEKRRKDKEQFETPRDPDEKIQSAIQTKMNSIADEIDALKVKAESILLSNSPIEIVIKDTNDVTKSNRYIKFDYNNSDRFKLLTLFLVKDMINYEKSAKLIYYKNDIELTSKDKKHIEIIDMFGLRKLVSELRKKLAIHSVIKKQIEDLKPLTNSIRENHSKSEILNSIEKSKEKITGFAQIYDVDTYLEIEELLKKYNEVIYSDTE